MQFNSPSYFRKNVLKTAPTPASLARKLARDAGFEDAVVPEEQSRMDMVYVYSNGSLLGGVAFARNGHGEVAAVLIVDHPERGGVLTDEAAKLA